MTGPGTPSPQASILSPSLPNPTRDPRQIFVAYSYNLYPKDDYRKPYTEIGKAFNVKFVFADEKITTLHILQKIVNYVRSSRFGIYDISGWNPNVTLELGLAFGLGEKAYIAIDPSKTKVDEVPADLRGIDRIQYGSLAELQAGLERVLAQELPLRIAHDVEDQLSALRRRAVEVVGQSHGLKVGDIARLLGVSVDVGKLLVGPLVGTEFEVKGNRRGARYHALKQKAPTLLQLIERPSKEPETE
jgi:hypothetical protein